MEAWIDAFIFFKRIRFFFTVHFNLLGKLAGKHEYVCNVHWSKMSPFWLKGACDLMVP